MDPESLEPPRDMPKPHNESAALGQDGGASSNSVLLSGGPSDHNPDASLTQRRLKPKQTCDSITSERRTFVSKLRPKPAHTNNGYKSRTFVHPKTGKPTLMRTGSIGEASPTGVSPQTVNSLRPKLSSEVPKIPRKVERGGTVYEMDTAPIGKTQAPPAAAIGIDAP